MDYTGKTNWQLNEIVKPEDMNRIEQGIIDAHENLLTHNASANAHKNRFDEFVKGVTGSNATLTITKGNGTTSAVTVNNVANATNATNATKATQDSTGQQISSTYIKGLSVSGKTITYTKGNDTTGTITTQDTVYTHPNSGVSAGTYRSVTVNAQGHVTAGSNPTTLSGYGITDAPTKTGGGASGTWGINISGNAASATNADKLDGYHASDLLRTLAGNRTPVMTDIFDRAGTIDLTNLRDDDKATHKACINKSQNVVQNLWNNATGIHAYGGDVNMANDYSRGALKLTQSYKNFDKILVVACDDDANVIKYRIWDTWELAHAFSSCFAFDILGSNIYWEIYGSVRTGDATDYVLSTDTIWNCYNQRSGIIAIYGIKY